ncbi:hypothetical protein MJO28_001044 [Puccinia striiformis f. sp. tritici]|uniref:Hydrophobin n=4 Tax=Puccinia striiformis TaxID=27350 RepID=A0A0L0V338_9BASI|nr:hypothetical protein Pst134EA_000205 [Puccinia striiformis f. sp. tritici]KAI9601553.1 hypothetical protein H4Q26_001378 [Puccinia striiformis f. sp. tritici PST-130]KNE93725.1 hypothetical protein PSTG_12913 [Puccinia striiformis f. sp. tritici PST-78]POW17367.1 hypothetical protein PSTT_00739 [Puccinia striiformis]KAH9466346.1 hypothetical protein Pst134EB_001401 [Puccinia striiformis f. sp. tritici]KAH9466365.1 hypothetical protein Pst134EB_001420 [Puccinia striiformis f. sp. tritici]
MQFANHLTFFVLAATLGLATAETTDPTPRPPKKSEPPRETFACPRENGDAYCGLTPEHNKVIIEGKKTEIYKAMEAHEVKPLAYDCKGKPLEKLLCCRIGSIKYFSEPGEVDKTRIVKKYDVDHNCIDLNLEANKM